MLGFRVSCSQVALEAYLSRKPARKVRAVEVPLGGQNTKNSSSALKSAIHVNSFLGDLSKLLQGNLYFLSTTLHDLKGGRGSIFCAFEMVGNLVFLSVASPQLQESQLWEGGGKIIIEVFNGSILRLVSVHPAPSGAEDQ
jgi:hypothetical protein